jgi:hypothetical protein
LKQVVASLLLLFLISPTLAATPRHELLRLVPDDVGFCLLIEDLRGHGKALMESPFFKQFLASPVAAKVQNAEETQKLGFLDKYLQQYLEVSAEQLRDEILGDGLVLAYRPGPPGEPAKEQGLFLIRARDPKLLAGLVERVNKLQKDSGDLKELEDRHHAGQTYVRRLESKGTNFYYLHGPVLAFGSQEAILQHLIELDQKAPRDQEPPLARQFRLSGVDRPLASLWVNPRAFEPELRQKAAAAAGSQQEVALKAILKYWQALEGIAVTVVLEKDLEVSLSVRAREEALPAAARRFLKAAAEPSELWRRFPENAMLAAAARIDVSALVEMLSDFLADDARHSLRGVVEGTIGSILGKDILNDLLANVGPEAGFCILAPPAEEKAWVPQLVAALRVRPGAAGAPADLTLLNALNSLATLVVFNHNGGQPGPLRLRTVLQDGVEIKYLLNEEKFPPGFQPAFALKDGYLLVASSPAAVRRFQTSAARPATAEPPLFRLSLREVTRYLKERRDPLLAHAAQDNHISLEEAGHRLDNLLLGLQFLDRVELSQRADPGRMILTLRVRLSQPLR